MAGLARIMAAALVFGASMPLGHGCTAPRGPLSLNPRTVAQRRMQTRRFDTADERVLLRACASLLLDLGFTVDASEEDLGLLVGSKRRSAVDAGQATLSFIARAFGIDLPVEVSQVLRASIVTQPIEHHLVVRATFQRIVWDEEGQVTRREQLNAPEYYAEFFEKLSKAVMLEALEL